MLKFLIYDAPISKVLLPLVYFSHGDHVYALIAKNILIEDAFPLR